MTDKEIIEAKAHFEYGIKCDYFNEPVLSYAKTVLEVIEAYNRQRAEIERLSDRNKKCIYSSDEETTEYCVDAICPQFKTEAEIKSEAIKEFAERLKAITDKEGWTDSCEIDDLVKEMVGDNK